MIKSHTEFISEPMSEHPVTPAYFTHFTCAEDLADLSLPSKFTFPFYYQPHPIAILAAEQLKQQLLNLHPLTSEQSGKMYGVLVVKNQQGQIGYLAAVSGKQDNLPTLARSIFVPAVFEPNTEDEYFIAQQITVNQLNDEISHISASLSFISRQATLASEQQAAEFQISRLQQQLAANRQQRKKTRQWLEQALQGAELTTEITAEITSEQHKKMSIQLSRESVQDKKQLAALKAYWQQRIKAAEEKLDEITNQLIQLKKARKKLSSSLQKRLFKQYQLLNINGEVKNLIELFQQTISPIPPAGSGDCAAPKLLQYAFNHQLTPITMAEFWWGNQPKSEIRKHQHFYPACQGKCLPILDHMLDGMDVDDNPLLINPASNLALTTVYQDQNIIVVNKPAGMLSVPGKSIEDSAYTRILQQHPGATVLHRLDMATSGLLVFALNTRAHKHLQQQFIDKTIEKRYIAQITGRLLQKEGQIDLPLIVDIEDRPRQKVCFTHGKPAKTRWQLISNTDTTTRLFLYPITGRTHQLRMHCAHPDGLNMPIIGDTLYGQPADRLHLHAQRLSFLHPITQEQLTFEAEPSF
ncbi:pseudouridine synthase [Colwellia sp. MEBiC06753]